MNEPRVSPSSLRNREPILDVLRQVLPESGHAIEVASGSGTHAAWFVPRLPGWTWQPTDLGDLDSIRGWRAILDEPRLREPVVLDVTEPWPLGPANAVFCANMIHIAPWRATLGLMRGAATALSADGVLVLYGPFHQNGATGEGNAGFDASLRERDPDWGIRELDAVCQVATAAGFALDEVVAMPADNRTVVFRRT
ncbi:MAG: DUF938 domain-containing protein [Myxococcota bacterium]